MDPMERAGRRGLFRSRMPTAACPESEDAMTYVLKDALKWALEIAVRSLARRDRVCCLLLSFSIAACDINIKRPVERIAASVGIVDVAPAPSFDAIVFCDHSAGSTCDPSTLKPVLSATLRHATSAAESDVHLYFQGDGVQVMLVGHARSGVVSARQADSMRRDAWITVETRRFLAAASPFLDRRRPRSPIAESISQVLYLQGPAIRPRQLVLMTDLREFSALGDFECGPLPTVADFLRQLQSRGLLEAGSLARTRVTVVGLSMPLVDDGRCEWSIAREKQLRALWKAAFLRAGAASVEFRSDFEWQEVDDVPPGQ